MYEIMGTCIVWGKYSYNQIYLKKENSIPGIYNPDSLFSVIKAVAMKLCRTIIALRKKSQRKPQFILSETQLSIPQFMVIYTIAVFMQ